MSGVFILFYIRTYMDQVQEYYNLYKRPGWYFNIHTQFMENILFEQKKINLIINGTFWKIKQRSCNMFEKCTKLPSCPNI